MEAKSESSVERTVTAFIDDYQEWAENGYSATLPAGLEARVTGEALSILRDDATMYSGHDIAQVGKAKVLSLKVDESSPTEATAIVRLDQSGVKVRQDGEERGNGQKVTELRISLVRAETWKINKQEVIDDGLN